MSSLNRYTYLATTGNLPVKPDGEVVILPGDSNQVYGVYTGEIVIWNPKTNLTLSVADIATEQHVSIGVGQGVEGQLADSIIHIAGEEFNMCDATFKAEVKRPVCGVPQVVDIFFDCTKTGEVYTLALHLDDSKVRSQLNYNEKAEYVYTAIMEEDSDTSIEEKCAELACAFVDQINGTSQKDPSKITYISKHDLTKLYQPFNAARLFVGDAASKRFVLDVDAEGTVGITGITIDGASTDFSYTTKAGDTTVTLVSQLDRVVDSINEALKETGGSAHLKASMSPKNCYTLEINTCADVVTLNTDAGALTPTTEFNPFTPQAKNKVCKDCDSSSATVDYTCGIRIFVDPVEVPCDCKYPPNLPAPNTYIRTVEPAFTGAGWDSANHYWEVSQEQVLPSGFGYFYQDKAASGQNNGGSGRNFRNSNRMVGRIGLPDEGSRASNAMNLIKCDETYCVYNITTTTKSLEKFNNAVQYFNTDGTYMMIPEAHTTTKNSFEPFLSALQTRGICIPGDVQCAVTITGATVSQSAVALSVGNTVNLDSTVEPAQASQSGTWSTADAAIATVDANGVVTGVAAGTVVITFTASDGTTTATSTVTVS